MYLQILEKVAMWVLNLVFEPNRCKKTSLWHQNRVFLKSGFANPSKTRRFPGKTREHPAKTHKKLSSERASQTESKPGLMPRTRFFPSMFFRMWFYRVYVYTV